MEILCPTDNLDEIPALIKAGADIFYAGLNAESVFSKDIIEKGMIANCRFIKNQNFSSLTEFKKAIELIHSHKKKIYFTLNTIFYSDKQITQIIKLIEKIKEIDGIILSDISLLLELKTLFKDLKLISSTSAHIFNNEAISFYKELGINTITIPRHFTIQEIKELVSNNPDMEFDVFIKNGGCPFNQGICNYTHNLNMPSEIYSSCDNVKELRFAKNSKKNYSLISRAKNRKNIYSYMCGACAIKEFNEIGVNTVKIVGRGMPTKIKINDIEFIKNAIIASSKPKEEFVREIKEKYSKGKFGNCEYDCMY